MRANGYVFDRIFTFHNSFNQIGEIMQDLTYKVVCISLYHEDLEELDKKVKQLKSKGFSKSNRSALIRAALDAFDIDSFSKNEGVSR